MTEAVLLARAETPLALRLVMWGVPLFLAGAAVLAFTEEPAVGILEGIVALLVAVFFWLAPRRLSYSLEPEALVIHRIAGRTTLPYAEIKARHSAGRLGVRLFGTGMPGYMTGLFTFGPDAISKVQAAASRGTGGVIVERGGTAYFLTPADPDAFLRSLATRGATVTA